MHGAGENATYYYDMAKKGDFHKNDNVKIMFM